MQTERWQHSDFPSDKTAIESIKLLCDWEGAVSNCPSQFDPTLKVPDLDFDLSLAKDETYRLYRELGAVTWASQPKFNVYGLSLTYNPDHDESIWKSASFGHDRYKKYSSYDYYSAVNNDTENRVKGDYLDSLGFRKWHPEIYTSPGLRGLFEKIAHPIVRVTARTQNGTICAATRYAAEDGGMHVDDSPFEVLRINVSLSNNEMFGLEYEGHEPIIWEPGGNFIVNTDVRHRAYIKESSEFLRTNLIIGVCPWLSYDTETDSWSVNEYFGKIHPYDMVREGLLTHDNKKSVLHSGVGR